MITQVALTHPGFLLLQLIERSIRSKYKIGIFFCGYTKSVVFKKLVSTGTIPLNNNKIVAG